MRGLDADIDQALARARSFMAQRDAFWERYRLDNQQFLAERASLLDSQVEELAMAVDDLYARREAVIEGCEGKLEAGKWNRPKPAIARGGGANKIMQVEEPRHRPGPVPLDHLTRPEGGSGPVDPEAIKESVDAILKAGKIPPEFKSIVDALNPGVGRIKFNATGGGGVRVDVVGQVGSGRFTASAEGSVQLEVRGGQLPAKADYPGPMLPFTSRLDDGLDRAVTTFNRDLYMKGLEVKGITVAPDGQLQITTGPR
jgi:hypothetical protein